MKRRVCAKILENRHQLKCVVVRQKLQQIIKQKFLINLKTKIATNHKTKIASQKSARMGRKKIQITRISDERNRQVTKFKNKSVSTVGGC